uniref:50S ribosomal protein L18 n=1 Tax=Heterorhabditis bacteriophora TaxID=37862 RepID=A0A1I7WMB4_HETBA
MPKKTDRYRRIMDLTITRPAQKLVLNCYTGHGSNYTSDVKRSGTADLRAKTAPPVTALLRHAFKQTERLSPMSGRGKGGKAWTSAQAKSRSSRAGLQFPVGRLHRMLPRGNYAGRIGAGTPIYSGVAD